VPAAPNHPLRIFHDGQVGEEVLTGQVLLQHMVAVDRDDVPQPLAGEIFLRNLLVVVAVITGNVLAERVRHHLVHIDCDSFQRHRV